MIQIAGRGEAFKQLAASAAQEGGPNSRKITSCLLVLGLLLVEEAGKRDNVGVDLFGVLTVLCCRHGGW